MPNDNPATRNLGAWYSPEPVDWLVYHRHVAYPEAIALMEERAAAIANGEARELVCLLEHPPLYTAGTSARPADLLDAVRFPVYNAGRGGQYTYHGPGQRVIYVMLDLNRRKRDVRSFIAALEHWVIAVLASLGVKGVVREGRVGVWVERGDIAPSREDKIAAIGIRLRRWVSLHGLSLNVSPNLDDFTGIVPCGIREHSVTSLSELLGNDPGMNRVDAEIERQFEAIFGPVQHVAQASATK
ncbi:MAG: hypothetical protein RLZ98_2837 [Pseudomonadota bacterium]|jgi:lipoyl(octanoyl) transferase